MATEQEIIIKLKSELELKQFQLSSLLEVTQAINKNFSREQLFNIYKFVLRTQLKVRKLALFVLDARWKCPILYGADPACEHIDVKTDLLQFTNIHSIDPGMGSVAGGVASAKLISEFQTVIPVLHKHKPLAYALIGDYDLQENELKNDLIPFIQTLTNIIIVAVENKKFAREQIRQEGIKKELELAAQMQSMLFPVTLPKDEHMEVYATYLPHREVGGDYYDCVRVNDNELVFCMADVSGKGIPAALLMSNFQANLHVLVEYTHSLKELAIKLNNKVMESAKGEKFITMFVARYNCRTRELTYINAGHNPPLLYAGGEVQQLKEGTTGLGMLDELAFINEGTLVLPKDSILLTYTDGVVETEDGEGELFGIERLISFVEENAGSKPAGDLHKLLIDHLTKFKDRRQFVDDITLLTCKFR